MSLSRKLGLAIVVAWFLGGGIAHFLITGFFVSIVPPYIPQPLMAVYVSGIFEILGGVGVLIAATRRWAGIGLFLLTICVTPANVYMWQHPELFPAFKPVLLSARLVVQVGLLACIYLAAIKTPVAAAAKPGVAPA